MKPTLKSIFASLLLLGLNASLFAVTDGAPAIAVLGQPDFVQNTVNPGGATASTINAPRKAFSDGTRLFVGDTGNHRVLIWNSLPTTTSQPADLVLGQADMSSVSANRGVSVAANTLNLPHGVFYDGTRLYVADYGNHRILIWDSLPTSNGQAADRVLGQADMVSGLANRGGSVGANTMQQPAWVSQRGGKLIVGDTFNHRVLLWNSLPSVNGQPADVVVGQSGFSTNAPSCGPASLQYPHQADILNGKLIIADTNNNRYLIYNAVPTSNGASADLVIGQSGLSSCGNNAPGLNAQAVSWAVGFTLDGNGDLWIADYGNHRALSYNGIPTSNLPSAVHVLGQADMSSGAINRTGSTTVPSADSLYHPYSLAFGGNKAYITDSSNNRVTIYDMPVNTPTATPTATASPSGTPTRTNGPTATASPSPSHSPSVTPTAGASPTASPTRTQTAGAIATPSPAPTNVSHGDRRVDCHPNFVHGKQGTIRVLARSYSGGRCSLKVDRANGRGLCDLWRGNLQPQEIHVQDWDTHDSQGGECASGVYYVVFTDGDGSIQTQKVLIAR